MGVHNGHDIKALVASEGQFDKMYDVLCNNLKSGETIFAVDLESDPFKKMCEEGLAPRFLPQILADKTYKVLKK